MNVAMVECIAGCIVRLHARADTCVMLAEAVQSAGAARLMAHWFSGDVESETIELTAAVLSLEGLTSDAIYAEDCVHEVRARESNAD